MGAATISITLIFSALIVVQCLPDLQEVDDVVADELAPSDDNEPVLFNRYYKRDWRQYICKYAKGRYPHDEDCSLYYECSSGKSKTFSCPKGEFFDPDQKKCRDSKLVKCKKGKGGDSGSGSSESKEHHGKFKCKKNSDGNFPDESDCKKYYSCKKGKTKPHTCPKNKLYDVGDEECRAQEDVHCGNRENPYDPESKTDFQCPKSKGSFAHEADCSKYYSCKDDFARLRTCPKHKLFDVGKEECASQEDVHCGNKKNLYDPESKTGFKCPKSKGSFSHEDDCTKYYTCKDDLARLRTCPKTKLYDAAKEECGNHEDVHCGNKINPYDPESKTEFECPKSKGSFAHEENCTKYYSCKNSLAKLITCPKKKLYDLGKGECRNHEEVHCGNKHNPYEPTGKRIDFKCPKITGEYPHDTECNKYYSCKYGLSKLKSCPKKKLFDVEREECLDAKKVKCGERVDPEGKTFNCPLLSFLLSYADPSDCKKYYVCMGIGTKPKSKTCPRDERFDPKKRICRNKNKVKCEIESEDEEEGFVCPISKSGNFSVHDDCSLYHTCLSSKSQPRSCPPEQLFDIKTAQCRDHKLVDCDSRFNPFEDESEISDEVDYKCPRPNGLFPHEKDCRSYYNCHNGLATVDSCPHGELYDVFKQRCANEKSVNCNDPIDPNALHHKHRRNRYRYFWCPRARGIFFHRLHCGLFYHCWHRRPSFRSCSRGRFFDIFRRRCYDQDFVDCGHRDGRDNDSSKELDDEEFKCPSSSGKYPHESECGKYYQCNRKNALLKTCPKGKLFDVNRKQCENHYTVDCGDRNDGEGVVDENNDFKCPSSRGNYPYKEDCSRYFSCSNKKPTLKACPVGQLYDVDRGDCEQDYRVDCGGRAKPDGTEEPSEDGFKCPTASGNYPHEFDCKKYYSCSNNLVSERKCRRGQLFDVNRGSCQQGNRVDCGGRIDDSSSSQEDSSEDNYKCPTSRGNHPHPECHMYYSCSDKKYTLKKCPDGQLYDVRRRDCDRWDKVDCGSRKPRFDVTTTVTPSTAYPTSSIKPQTPTINATSSNIEIEKTTLSTRDQPSTRDITEKPRDESSTEGRTSTEQVIRNGTRSGTEEPITNIVTGNPITVEPSTEIDGDSKTICPTSNGLYPHKKDCKKYYYCDNSIPVLMVCKGSELFDARKSRCSQNVDCGRRQNLNDSKEESEEPSYRCPSSYGNYPHEDCQWYYVCIRKTFTLKKCPYDKMFDTTTHKCETSNRVDCGGRQLPHDKITENPTTNGFTTVTQKTQEPSKVTNTNYPVTGDSTHSGTDRITDSVTKEPGKIINPKGSDATDSYTASPMTDSFTRTLNPNKGTGSGKDITWPVTGKTTDVNTKWPVTGTRKLITGKGTESNTEEVTGSYTERPTTGKGTDLNIGEITDIYTGWPVTGTKRPVTGKGTDSNIGEVTDTYTGLPITGSERPVTGTGSNIGEVTDTNTGFPVTGTSRPITGTGSNIGEVTDTYTGMPVTGTSRPVTGTRRPVTGTRKPATGTSRPVTGTGSNVGEVTDTYTGLPVTGTRKPVTDTRRPVTGTRRPVTGTSRPVTGTSRPVTGTRRPVTGTGPNIGEITDTYTGLPVTGTRRPVTDTGSNIGEVTDTYTGLPVTGTRRPITGTGSNIGEVTDTYTGMPVTGTRRPVTGTSRPVTGTRRPVTGTGSNVGEVTDTYTGLPVTGTRGPVTGTGPNIGEVTDIHTGLPVTGTRRPVTGTVSNIGEVTDTYTGLPVTGTRKPVTDTRRPVTGTSRPVTASNVGEVTDTYTKHPITGSGNEESTEKYTVSSIFNSTGIYTDTAVTDGLVSRKIITDFPGKSTYITVLPTTGKPDVGKLTASVTSSGKFVTNELVTGNEGGTETSSTGNIQKTTNNHLITREDEFTNDITTTSKQPDVITIQPSTGDDNDENKYVCPTKSDNHPYNDDCKKYYNCTDAIPVLTSCSGQKLFDAKRKICTSKKVDCGSRYDPDGSGESKEWKHDCPSSKEGKYPNKYCDQYYVCNKKKYQIKKCPSSELFDAITQTCEPSYRVDCGGRKHPYDETTVMIGSTENGKDTTVSNRVTGEGYSTAIPSSRNPITNDVTVIGKTIPDVVKDKNVTVDQTGIEKITTEIVKDNLTVSTTEREIKGGSTSTTSRNPVTADGITTANPPISRNFTKADTDGTTSTPEVITDVNQSTKTETSTETGITPGIGKLTKSITENTPPTANEVTTNRVSEGITSHQTNDAFTTVSSEGCKTSPSKVITPTRFVIPETTTPRTTTEKPEGILYCPEPNGIFPHPDPHKWVHCSNWEPHIKECPGNLVFNRKLKVCSWTLSFAQEIPLPEGMKKDRY